MNGNRYREVGVEGPPHWRDDLTFIACPFGAGRCDCGGEMKHTNFAADVEYFAPRKPIARAVFRVPREYVMYPTQGMREDGTVIIAKGDHAFLSLNLAGVA